MPTKRIPFVPNEMSVADQLGGAQPSAINVMLDQRGVLRRRPGIQALPSAGSSVADADGIEGLFATSRGEVFAVAKMPSRAIYRVAGGATSQLLGLNQLTGSLRPVFAETEAMVAIADGTVLTKVLLAGYGVSPVGGNTPAASHVLFNSSRLLANDVAVDRSKVNYSDLATSTVTTGHETWGGSGSSGFFSGEARPDPVTAIGENTNEVFVWGTTSLEIYGPDPLYIFARLTTREYGCASPYSIIKSDGSFAWVDPRGRFILSDGRSVQDLSGGVSGNLSVADQAGCFGYRVDEGDTDAFVWALPESKRTVVYQKGAGWSRWAQQGAGGTWSEFPVTAHAFNPATGEHIVGLSSGRIAKLQWDAVDDLGETIPAFVETGFVDHDSSRTKVTSRLRVVLRRGTTASTTEPLAFIQYADAPGKWSSKIPIGLGAGGDTEPEVTLYSLGAYRRRAWRFIFNAAEPLSLVHVEEDFEWGEE